ncbi:MAG: endonuclease/exonuclease/phosphatase family protein [Anaerolineales bacterium]|nr:endonuclease/exonuclease/phosphatase family protein [Anaerolineales bacterium]
MQKSKLLLTFLIVLLISGCASEKEPAATQPEPLDPVPVKILISEVLTGMDGNNQADFVELYNAGTEIADLDGYSLWHQLKDDTEEVLIYHWNETTLVPPLGFYALVQEGQDFGVVPDRVINQSLVPTRGGLALRKGDTVEDQLTWGTGPASLIEGSPAITPTLGSSLTRNLDPGAESKVDSDNNQADFSLDPSPTLQNSGSPVNHPASQKLSFSVEFPEVVKPGSEFTAQIVINNQTGQSLENISISLPLPDHIYHQDGSGLEGLIEDHLPELAESQNFVAEIPLQADFTFADFEIRNSYLTAGNWPLPAFSGPFYGEIGGGPIPISTARGLFDKEVVVQGISTMYVGGFFAGSGAKFYIEDESGGVQVYVSGAGNSLVVPLGSTVQVKGKIEIYRDSVELIPSTENLVEIIAGPGESKEWVATPVTIDEINSHGESYTGSLVEVECQVARIEEFSYSYEIDLFDESGNLVSLYLDKETGITLEELEADQFYRVTGIMELFDGNLRLYPRIQSDLSRIYEPGLAIRVSAPTSAISAEPFDVVYIVTNHSPDPDQNLVISVKVDPQLEVLKVLDQGRMENNTIVWDMDKIAGGGEEVSVSFQAQLTADTEYVIFDNYRVISSTWSESQYGITSYTFSGETVPIWAIQGTSTRSSYNLAKLTTQGVVTGVFPELEGFWIQEKESDDDPGTSPGLFIRTGLILPDVNPGDLVIVTGRVREAFQQTELELISKDSINIVGKSALPVPVELDPPPNNEASLEYYEALEGVLVSAPGPANVVGPTTRYGEFSIIPAYYGMARSWQDQDHGMLIHVDDGSNLTHENRDMMEYAVAVGDTIYGITGPLAFTYSNYKIEPISSYIVQASKPNLQYLDPLEEGLFSIMTWNVENLFDFIVPHPSSPPLPRVSEYKRDITKVAKTIEAAGFPTVIGFQEVENLEILEDVAADPLLADYNYLPVLIEGTDSRGIDVGYLVRGDRASIIDQVQYPAPGNITSRPPLLIEIELSEGSSTRLTILNNHFTSMSGGEKATEPRRNAQAAWNAEIAQELLDENPDSYLAVMGDLNSYYQSLPLLTLEAGGLINVFDVLEPEQRYTYVYEGSSQVLDHILVNDSLYDLLVRVDVLHFNADYPLPLSTDGSYVHKSDHDPLVTTFFIP